MRSGFDVIGEKLSKISSVSRTWFEWEWSHEDNALVKTLIIEVSFDTDPNSANHDRSALQEIERAAQDMSQKTSMVIPNFRIVPKARS